MREEQAETAKLHANAEDKRRARDTRLIMLVETLLGGTGWSKGTELHRNNKRDHRHYRQVDVLFVMVYLVCVIFRLVDLIASLVKFEQFDAAMADADIGSKVPLGPSAAKEFLHKHHPSRRAMAFFARLWMDQPDLPQWSEFPEISDEHRSRARGGDIDRRTSQESRGHSLEPLPQNVLKPGAAPQ